MVLNIIGISIAMYLHEKKTFGLVHGWIDMYKFLGGDLVVIDIRTLLISTFQCAFLCVKKSFVPLLMGTVKNQILSMQ